MAEATECPSPCGGPDDPGHVPDAKPLTLQQMIDLREIKNVPPPVRLPKSEAFARGDVPANDPVSWARTLRAVADKLTEAGQSNALAMTGALTTGLVARGAYQAASDVERLEKGQPDAVIQRARNLLRTTVMSYSQAMALAESERSVIRSMNATPEQVQEAADRALAAYPGPMIGWGVCIACGAGPGGFHAPGCESVDARTKRAAERLQEDLQPAYRRAARAAASTFRALVESHRATAEATADQISDLVEELETAVPVAALREEARRQLLEAQGRDKLMAYGNRAETTWRRAYPVLAALADRGEE